MSFWVWLVIEIIVYVLEAALTPKPKDPEAQHPQVPTAEEGRPKPVIFGMVWIDDSQVLWWGDELATPIKTGGKK